MADWYFDVFGQPPTTNHLYTRVRGQWNRMAKAEGVEEYQTTLAWVCRTTRPAGWKPPESGFIRVEYEFHLRRDADADNLLKAIQDAIATALGVNDRVILPCVNSKEWGCKVPYTRIGITALPSPVRPASPTPTAPSPSSATSPRPSPYSPRDRRSY